MPSPPDSCCTTFFSPVSYVSVPPGGRPATRRSGVRRQVQAKRRAFLLAAVHGDTSTVLLHNAEHAGQPNPSAGNPTGHIRSSIEPIEDVRQLLTWNTHSLVNNGN